MTDTPNLTLPSIFASQAQKHVTHNEAIAPSIAWCNYRSKAGIDKSARFLLLKVAGTSLPAGASDVWAGKSDKIAAFQDGAWAFYAPKDGWIAWVARTSSSFTTRARGRRSLGGGGGGVTDHGMLTGLADDDQLQYLTASRGDARYTPIDPVTVGVNATADMTNRLALSSPASLFNHEGNGHQVKINKGLGVGYGIIPFQDGFSGRAEIGLTGDDDFHFKLSPDGSAWFDSIRIDRATGKVSFPASGGARELLTANRTYYVRMTAATATTALRTPRAAHSDNTEGDRHGSGIGPVDLQRQLFKSATAHTR